MTLTLLIDLDDTLLSNSMDTFIPAYLDALGKHYAEYTDSNKLRSAMNLGTQKMFLNDRPDRSLKNTFDLAFYPMLGITEEEVREHNSAFYAEIFPTLGIITDARPDAVCLIDEASQRGWQIAIATNPYFPLMAILHRLTWAEIPVDEYDYAIVPSYETFHFGKPNPAFFAEMLGRIGWPSGPIVMVGNDPENDIKAANLMGIPAYWITNEKSYPDEFPKAKAAGNLNDIIPWIDVTPEEDLIPDFNSESAILATMRGVPSAMLSLTKDLSVDTWRRRPLANEWSLTEIACHLRDVEREINHPRFEKITKEKNPFIPGVDSDAWAEARDYQSQDGISALAEFVSLRIKTLKLLDNLSPEAWQRPVQHAIFGPTDLKEIASIAAGHDRLHTRQIHAII
jgi:FMN phosphatase YigB (HAD superfamily)